MEVFPYFDTDNKDGNQSDGFSAVPNINWISIGLQDNLPKNSN